MDREKIIGILVDYFEQEQLEEMTDEELDQMYDAYLQKADLDEGEVNYELYING